MRRFITCLIFALGIIARGQTISVTATITDSDSQTWNNGTWAVKIYSPKHTPTYNGSPVSTATQKGSLDSGGALAVTLNNTSTITPTGALYTWTLCPNASVSCQTFNTQVVTTDLSSLLSSMIAAPRFQSSPQAFGYLDVEVIPTPQPGGTYYNVTTPAWRQWNGSAWGNVGGGGTPTGPAGGSLAGTYPNPTLSSPVTAPSDGVHAGMMDLGGNTTNPPIPANEFGWLGFNSAGATSYFFQPSTTAPSGTQLMTVGTPSGNVSQVTYTSLQGTDSKVMTAGTVSGTAATLCTDANGGATTSGCSSGGSAPSYWGISGYYNDSNPIGSVANQLNLVALPSVPSLAGVNHLVINVEVADGTNNSSICIYNANGTLAAHTAPTTYGSTGTKVIATVESNASITGGKVYVGFTSVGTTLKLGAAVDFALVTYANGSFVATSGGACPGSITPPTDSWTPDNNTLVIGMAP